MKYTDTRDVTYIATVICCADRGFDCYDVITEKEQRHYLKQADAVLRAIEIRRHHE